MDGVAIARERVRRLKAAAAGRAAAQTAAPESDTRRVTSRGRSIFARTTDGGATWEPAREIYDPGPNAQTIGNLIVVPPNGNVIDFFIDILPNGALRLALLRSFDKGKTWETSPTIITTISDSSNGTITPDLQESVRDGIILFSVAVDPKNGRLYIVWQDTRFGSVDQVAFSQSSDNGVDLVHGRSGSTGPRPTPTCCGSRPSSPRSRSARRRADRDLLQLPERHRARRRKRPTYWAVFCAADCTRRSSWGGVLRLTNKSFDMLDAPIARRAFPRRLHGPGHRGGTVHPVFGIATGPDLTTEFTRRIILD